VLLSTVVIVPVLSRPQNVRPLIESLEEATPEPHRLLFVASPHCCEELAALQDVGAEFITVPYKEVGDYARKVNAAYEQTDEPFLFLGADDLRFHWGWLSAAMKRMADPAVGVVGTQDQGNARVLAGIHSTHSLVRRAYIDAYGTIDTPRRVLHEDYWHEYVDDELIGTAKHRGAWAFAADSTVEHLHPHYGKAPTDDVYERQRERMSHSRQLYRYRSRLWA
jgi:glycosyltransferase involved in cell wall biosynthesis